MIDTVISKKAGNKSTGDSAQKGEGESNSDTLLSSAKKRNLVEMSDCINLNAISQERRTFTVIKNWMSITKTAFPTTHVLLNDIVLAGLK